MHPRQARENPARKPNRDQAWLVEKQQKKAHLVKKFTSDIRQQTKSRLNREIRL